MFDIVSVVSCPIMLKLRKVTKIVHFKIISLIFNTELPVYITCHVVKITGKNYFLISLGL